MTASTSALQAPHAEGFAPQHRWDRNFFLSMVGLIWLGILMGFGGDILRHSRAHEPPYPLIVHFHAVVMVSWLGLLTAQVLLIRAGKAAVHRKLGIAGAALAPVMVILGPATAIVVHRGEFGGPHSDPSFMSIQLTDMVAFSGLVAAGLLLRGDSPAHKRLMLLSTLYISDAGFARWLAGPIVKLLGGPGFWSMDAGLYTANDLLILALGAYDLITRRRLHPAYVAGAAWALANQLTAVSLYFSPAWKAVALKLIGH